MLKLIKYASQFLPFDALMSLKKSIIDPNVHYFSPVRGVTGSTEVNHLQSSYVMLPDYSLAVAMMLQQQDILDRLTEYIGDLFDDTGDMLDFDETSELTENDILESEVEAALKGMKFGKSPGNYNITAEMLIASKKISVNKIFHLANKIYRTGTIPKQMKESVFIPLPKKGDLLECAKYHLISLMSHITKIILRIIMRRIRSKLLPEISEEQFGFKKDCGT